MVTLFPFPKYSSSIVNESPIKKRAKIYGNPVRYFVESIHAITIRFDPKDRSLVIDQLHGEKKHSSSLSFIPCNSQDIVS